MAVQHHAIVVVHSYGHALDIEDANMAYTHYG